jgi:hypothetical protein
MRTDDLYNCFQKGFSVTQLCTYYIYIYILCRKVHMKITYVFLITWSTINERVLKILYIVVFLNNIVNFG